MKTSASRFSRYGVECAWVLTTHRHSMCVHCSISFMQSTWTRAGTRCLAVVVLLWMASKNNTSILTVEQQTVDRESTQQKKRSKFRITGKWHNKLVKHILRRKCRIPNRKDMRANEKESAGALSSMSRRFYEFSIVTTRKLPLWFNSCAEKLFLHSQCSPAAPPITRRYVFVVPKSFSMSWFGIWYFPFGFLNTSLWLCFHSHSHFTSTCDVRSTHDRQFDTNYELVEYFPSNWFACTARRSPKARNSLYVWEVRLKVYAHGAPSLYARCGVAQMPSGFSSKKWKVRFRFHFTYSLNVGWL